MKSLSSIMGTLTASTFILQSRVRPASGKFISLALFGFSGLTFLLQLAAGAPAYTARQAQHALPCIHAAHATLCWALQLKQPLHFRVPLAVGAGSGSMRRPSPLQPDTHAVAETLDKASVHYEIPDFNFSSVKNEMRNEAADGDTGSRVYHSWEKRKLEEQKVLMYEKIALELADEVGLHLVRKVGELYDHFVLCHDTGTGQNDVISPEAQQGIGSLPPSVVSGREHRAFRHYHEAHQLLRNTDSQAFDQIRTRAEDALRSHHDVAWFAMETVHYRQKRSSSLIFNDPKFHDQWHLVNKNEKTMDINVTGVWNAGITGKGVTVAVVDDGLEWNNPDLHDNYNALGSWDLNDNDPDPMPDGTKISNHHGTRCAGEIAAVANNSVCGVGVSYKAKVSGIRLLDGPMTDSLEAEAFNKKFDINAIYSCSWGPDDDGKTVDGPHILAAKAMKYGVEFGRHGYGSIFVVASGNGGSQQDNCNYDGYANSIYTVTIGAVDESGAMPYYAEECASMLGVTFSSGVASLRDIVTTDWLQKGSSGCTEKHTGTSAAAPLAAGMIALMLNAQPCLTWRDVQYLIIVTSVKLQDNQQSAHWQKNAAGLEHSHRHGFGLISTWRLVNAARVWKSVPWMTSYSTEDASAWVIPHGPTTPLIVQQTVTDRDISGYSLFMLEYVQVTLTLTHPARGHLGIHLRCPSGTLSVIGAPRPNDNSTEGFTDWTFTTVRCWGEPPTGDWMLNITDQLSPDSLYATGKLIRWRLTLFGTPMTTKQFMERRREVEEAMHGGFLSSNYTLLCDPPPNTSPPYIPLSDKTLKILFLSSMFCLVLAVYEMMEYMLCYNEEKRQQAQETQQATSLQRRSQRATSTSSSGLASETAALLQDNERDTEFLQQAQSAFDDEENDMFLLDSGIAAGIGQARRQVNGIVSNGGRSAGAAGGRGRTAASGGSRVADRGETNGALLGGRGRWGQAGPGEAIPLSVFKKSLWPKTASFVQDIERDLQLEPLETSSSDINQGMQARGENSVGIRLGDTDQTLSSILSLNRSIAAGANVPRSRSTEAGKPSPAPAVNSVAQGQGVWPSYSDNDMCPISHSGSGHASSASNADKGCEAPVVGSIMPHSWQALARRDMKSDDGGDDDDQDYGNYQGSETVARLSLLGQSAGAGQS